MPLSRSRACFCCSILLLICLSPAAAPSALGQEAAEPAAASVGGVAWSVALRNLAEGGGASAGGLAAFRLEALGPGVAVCLETRGGASPGRLRIAADSALASKDVQVTAGGKALASGKLPKASKEAALELLLPLAAPADGALGVITIQVGEQPALTVTWPGPELAGVLGLIRQQIAPGQYVFTGQDLPEVRFPSAPLPPAGLTSCTVETTYLNRRRQPVTQAESGGRYAAIAQITPDKSRVSRRFFTLYRLPRELDWRGYRLGVIAEVPEDLGVPRGILTEQSPQISRYFRQLLLESLDSDPNSARLLAGLSDMTAGGGLAPYWDDVWARDKQWWVEQKRTLYGTDKLFAQPVTAPKDDLRSEAAELTEGGDPQEAGMQNSAPRELAGICQTWAMRSGDALSICAARKGVVFFHEAFGVRGETQMTATTKVWAGSLAQTITAIAALELVDQQLADLDAPLEKYLPALKGVTAKQPLTLRRLLTHTSGLWGDWGDDLNDMEELVADFAPHLVVGTQPAYSGTNAALAGKVIESISGEALPAYLRKHVLEPLGCRSTEVRGAAEQAWSTDADMARLGQMLLSKGAYGRKRFFSEATAQALLPAKLTSVLGESTTAAAGLGVMPLEGLGLSSTAFGCVTETGSLLAVDPENQLVVAIARPAATRGQRDFDAKLMKAILGQLAGDDASQGMPGIPE